MTELLGLSDHEVKERQAAGQSNNVKLPSSRSYTQILSENLFTFVNTVFFIISGVFLLLQRPTDAVFVAVIVFSGVVIGIYQEIWAKRKLDQIALLHRPQATVIRNGQKQEIDPEGIVLGDLLWLSPGDQVLVDGTLKGDGRIEVDESLLTGESDLIGKGAGQPLYSGSFCVSGSACYEAQKIGSETLAFQLIVGARAFRQIHTPLQREINLIIRTLLLLACFLWLLVGISYISQSQPLNEVVQRAAVVAGVIPAGLLLAITLAYALGAVRMLGQNVLIQQTNAVESLSNVNVLCLDKTGTLTTNQINLESIFPIAASEAELQILLGDYAANMTTRNRTLEAIVAAYPGCLKAVKTEISFSSARKWSAMAFSDPTLPGIYVLGAPEILSPLAPLDAEVDSFIQQQVQKGWRVVLFAHSPEDVLIQNDDSPSLPTSLFPLAILSFSDQLRPSARQTLQGFAKAGILVKIISGDHPETVAALAQQSGFMEQIKLISGQELAQMTETQFIQAAQNHTVFGRVTPEQKAQLVKSLRSLGYYVGMTGDGVNDVLSLKQANLSIAMESGSQATRGVADIVLLNDSFEALPHAFLEGQRIRNGIQDVLKLFMVRLSCVTLLIFATAIVTHSFPLMNKHSAIVTLIGVGFPTIFIPIWAKSGEQSQRSMVRSMLHFVIPATLTMTLVSLFIYLFYLVSAVLDLSPASEIVQVDYGIPRTALVTILVFCELLLIPFLKPPTTAWVGGESLSGDWRYSIVSGALLILYLLILFIQPLRDFFELSPLGILDCLFLGLVAIEWCFIVRLTWRTRFLDRFLGVDLG